MICGTTSSLGNKKSAQNVICHNIPISVVCINGEGKKLHHK
jgi:hypothetical protein